MQIKCPNCSYEGKSKTFTKGNVIIELFLWLFFIFPGLIYSIWRLSTRYKGCPKCSYQYVIRK
jgi:DNA-directed RNA polymerase subunit RPC12/RpoP